MPTPLTFDFDHAVQVPFRMQPGLRRLPEGRAQLSPNRPGARHLREKLAVLHHWPGQALLQQPGFDAGPALDALARQAQDEHPHAWRVHEDGRWEACLLGWSVSEAGAVQEQDRAWVEVGNGLRQLPPAQRRHALLALAFAEDFAIVDGAHGTLPWLAVCLPSHWAPEEKLGRHFAEVHAPVADNALLLQAGEHLMRLACAPQRWERFVWNLTPHPRLHAHPQRLEAEAWSHSLKTDEPALQTWLRTERQTFIPLPEHQQAVFTILVDCQPLAQALTSPSQAQRLHDSLASMSPAVLAYRQLDAARAPLLDWLQRQAAT